MQVLELDKGKDKGRSPYLRAAEFCVDLLAIQLVERAAMQQVSYAHVCSRMLTYAHVCSRMLTYAHVCSRMLTYAHVCSRMLKVTKHGDSPELQLILVCSRMLTYAHVCSRMLTYDAGDEAWRLSRAATHPRERLHEGTIYVSSILVCVLILCVCIYT
jgi:hypothetical protein